MNSAEWKKVKEIFNEAFELPKTERPTFLAQFADEIRHEVEKMLAADDEESLLLNAPIVDFKDFAETDIPDQIGDYKIIREIGQGGMGTVYEALRETENFKQKVALKIIRRGMNNDVILKRFRSEQQILATLEHPNIGRFLDGGKTADGLPFYAMEFIEGVAIDEFCRENNLSVAEKIRLFREVCAAVSYAHTNLIVHRDLKPSNIIVTKTGTPKLLDFGIAKLLDVDSKEVGTATQFGMMTPQYASPEQIRGEKVTTLSDVYSLGTIFYEILTGARPYQTENKNYAEILEIITQTNPTKPSENPQSAIRNPQLKGDIDTIVLKTLQKDSSRRYQSVQEFSEDLRRHLEGLPISARPDTFQYRLGKFVARNKIGVAAAAIVFLSLLTGIAVASWQAYRAEKQRLLAEKRFSEVRNIANNVVFKYTEAITNLPNSAAVREMLLQDASNYLDNLAQDAKDDLALQRELSNAYTKLSDLQGAPYGESTGNTEKAIENLSKALAIEESILANNPNEVEVRRKIITTYTKLGDLTYVSANEKETRNNYQKAENLLKEFLQKEPENPDLLKQLARLQMQIGSQAAESSLQMEIARQYQRQSLEIAQKLLSLMPNDASAKSLTATARARYGMLSGHPEHSEADDLKTALDSFRQAVELRRRLAESDPQNVGYKRQLATTLIYEADILKEQKNFAESLKKYDEAQNIFENLSKRDANDFYSLGGLAMVLSKFGEALTLDSQTDPGLTKLQTASRMYEQFLADKKGDISIKNTFFSHLIYFGEALERGKKPDEAEKVYQRATELQKQISAEAKGFRILEINSTIIQVALAVNQLENKRNLPEAKSTLENGLQKLRELKNNNSLFRRYENLYQRAENLSRQTTS